MPAESKSGEKQALEAALEACLSEVCPGGRLGLGVDVQLIPEINIDNPNFLERNFTEAEIAYCRAAPDPHASFAGRWAAKEAVAKAVMNLVPEGPNLSKGAGAPLLDVEIVPLPSGAPGVRFSGYAEETVRGLGITEVRLSISHSGEYVAAGVIVATTQR